MMQFQIKC